MESLRAERLTGNSHGGSTLLLAALAVPVGNALGVKLQGERGGNALRQGEGVIVQGREDEVKRS